MLAFWYRRHDPNDQPNVSRSFPCYCGMSLAYDLLRQQFDEAFESYRLIQIERYLLVEWRLVPSGLTQMCVEEHG